MNMDAKAIRTEDKTKTLGYRLFLSRRDLEWNQEDVAVRAGVSRGYISKIERGKITNVGKDVLEALAHALGVSPAYLSGFVDDPLAGLDDEEEPVPESKSAAQTLDTLTREFLSIFQQLGDDKRKTLLDLARMLRAADEPRIIGEDP